MPTIKTYHHLSAQERAVIMIERDHGASRTCARSTFGVRVQRKTRFVVRCRMDGCTAAAVLEGFTRQMRKRPALLRQSLTYDRGSERACHVHLSRQLNIAMGFCDPHAPWQRVSNENTHGLLR